SMPFMVILAVPLALLGAIAALWLRGMQIDVFSEIGFVMLIGLAAKNAILIVEFAKRLREEGHGIIEAAMEAGRLRIRPILMTAFAFILGVAPLMIASGAGAASRQSIGTTVFGAVLASFLALSAGEYGGGANAAPATPKSTPALPVPAITVVKKTVPLYLDYVGMTEPIRTVTLQAKVTGYLAVQAAGDGADVKT